MRNNVLLDDRDYLYYCFRKLVWLKTTCWVSMSGVIKVLLGNNVPYHSIKQVSEITILGCDITKVTDTNLVFNGKE